MIFEISMTTLLFLSTSAAMASADSVMLERLCDPLVKKKKKKGNLDVNQLNRTT